MGKAIVACCQLAPRIGEPDYNRQISTQAIRNAAQRGANIIVLPELVNSGYVFQDRAEAAALSEPCDGPSISLWAALARELDVVVVAGFCETLGAGQVANSCVLIDARGVRAVYRKVHLWHEESAIFTAGDQSPPVIETRFGQLSMMICYDLEFPEWVRLPALSGAQLLCAPVNWPSAPPPQGERPVEVVKVQANAAVNRLFIAVSDRCGKERGVDWVGGSVIVDADGYPLAGAESLPGEGMLLAEIDLSAADDKHIGRYNHVHRDRRPMLY
ncbi:nitrilase family protein [Serratia plymuthica]|uniref:nitrilase family protein n=1 Tax=Serratia plymuthica TaxID=82996 RepID=UPI001BAF0DD2|nr:nitrilase family protein [Serratia plymuthica]QUY49858.1 nitrilase family protein [Serratia plymuthica]